EEVLICTAADYGIDATRVNGLTGVWVEREKLAAIGVRIARWITSHGFAFNVATDLTHFGLIVPCGVADRGVTSVERLLGRRIDQHEVEGRITAHFLRIFDRVPTNGDCKSEVVDQSLAGASPPAGTVA